MISVDGTEGVVPCRVAAATAGGLPPHLFLAAVVPFLSGASVAAVRSVDLLPEMYTADGLYRVADDELSRFVRRDAPLDHPAVGVAVTAVSDYMYCGITGGRPDGWHRTGLVERRKAIIRRKRAKVTVDRGTQLRRLTGWRYRSAILCGATEYDENGYVRARTQSNRSFRADRWCDLWPTDALFLINLQYSIPRGGQPAAPIGGTLRTLVIQNVCVPHVGVEWVAGLLSAAADTLVIVDSFVDHYSRPEASSFWLALRAVLTDVASKAPTKPSVRLPRRFLLHLQHLQGLRNFSSYQNGDDSSDLRDILYGLSVAYDPPPGGSQRLCAVRLPMDWHVPTGFLDGSRLGGIAGIE